MISFNEVSKKVVRRGDRVGRSLSRLSLPMSHDELMNKDVVINVCSVEFTSHS